MKNTRGICLTKLYLKKENIDCNVKHIFLNLTMKIENDKLPTAFYDELDPFSFNKMRMPLRTETFHG